jgi:hypothetical protein
MVTQPDGLTLKHHRDLVGRERQPWTRRVLLGVVGVLIVLALLNVFGQRPSTTSGQGAAAELEVYSPERVRGGLYFETRFHIKAIRELKEATIVLDPGWLEGMTLNTVEPSPIAEASRDGKIAFELGRIPAGEKYLFFLQFQVNPTNIGRRSNDVQLYDGEQLVLELDRTITVWP